MLAPEGHRDEARGESVKSWIVLRCPRCGRTEYVVLNAACACPCALSEPKGRMTEMVVFHEAVKV